MSTTRFLRTDAGDAPIAGWFKSRSLRKRVRTTPTIALADLAEDTPGHVVAAVQISGERSLVAPLSDLACVYYALTIYEGDRLIGGEHLRVPFVVEQDGARAMVDLEHAYVGIDTWFSSRASSAYEATPVQLALLKRLELLKPSVYDPFDVRFFEAVLAPGSEVHVLGAGIREPDPDAGFEGIYRDGGQTRLRFFGSSAHPLVISHDLERVSF